MATRIEIDLDIHDVTMLMECLKDAEFFQWAIETLHGGDSPNVRQSAADLRRLEQKFADAIHTAMEREQQGDHSEN